jgi:hypothetical protein
MFSDNYDILWLFLKMALCLENFFMLVKIFNKIFFIPIKIMTRKDPNFYNSFINTNKGFFHI